MPLDHSASIARPSGYAESSKSAERSARWASRNDLDQGGERGAYVALETSGLRKRGIAYGTRVLRRRSPHSSRRRHDRPRRTGKPSTGRRGSPRKRARADSWHELAGQVPTRPRRGGTRDAERRDAPGDHSRPRQARTAAGARLSAALQPGPVPARVRQDRPQPWSDDAGRDGGDRGRDQPGEDRCHHRRRAL
jgi:hypothetical protein